MLTLKVYVDSFKAAQSAFILTFQESEETFIFDLKRKNLLCSRIIGLAL
jgi:hypothetical protein